MRLSGLLNLRRSGQAKRVTVPGAAQWVTHSTCLNDQLEVKVQRIVTARPMCDGSFASFEASSSDVGYYPERWHSLALQYLSQRANIKHPIGRSADAD